jgi:hypothetical protein
MKNIKLNEFKNSLSEVISDVIHVGEIYRVDSGLTLDKNEKETGAFVIMEEPEYKIMRDALAMIFGVNSVADKDGIISIHELLKKAGIPK